jgi:L-aspartate oxidase
MNIVEADVLIIGSGIAGLMAAEYLSMHKNVIVITKSGVEHSNSYMAQGGISAAISKTDHWRNHYDDTLQAGHHHNHPEMTEHLVKESQKVIQTLFEWGVPFDRTAEGRYLLGKEGGHHFNRIVHAGGDQTGKKIMEVLIERVKKKANIVSGQYAIDLIVDGNQCYGVYCKDEKDNITMYHAPHTILAGGGYAGIYSVSSNSHGSDGSAICMAYRAGADLADLEFIQFHPTLLKHEKYTGLITEAVRGQGGILVNSRGVPVMNSVHPMEDLAPRDIVSRRLFEEIHVHGETVYLDITGISDFKQKFPGVTALCKKAGVSLEKGFIPVSPGAHFTMGGIMTDIHGRTTLKGLYAIGECAHTGVHGANRLASNSLLEGAVFAKQSAEHILGSKAEKSTNLPFLQYKWFLIQEDLEDELLEEMLIKKVMNESAGICRNKVQLELAAELLQLSDCKPSLFSKPLSYIRRLNIQTMAWLTVSSCLTRTESRGSHYRIDYPITRNEWCKKNIVRSLKNDESTFVKKAVTGLFN